MLECRGRRGSADTESFLMHFLCLLICKMKNWGQIISKQLYKSILVVGDVKYLKSNMSLP